MSTTNVLITGAARGLGKGLVAEYLLRPKHTVIAAVRNTTEKNAEALRGLPKAEESKLVIIKIDAASETDPATAIEELQSQGISHLDVVIANAGVAADNSRVDKASIDTIMNRIRVNALSPVLLFQTTMPLLSKSKQPIFTGVGSALGSIGGMEQRPYPSAAYGASKALLHYYLRKIHFENENLIAFVLDPGFVQTDMGNAGAKAVGLEKAFTTIDDCVAGMTKILDSAKRDTHGGKNMVWDGTEFPF